MSLKQTAQAIVARTAKNWLEDKQATATLKALGPVLAEQLATTGKADIPGVGTLRVHALPEKPARHPLSGDKIKVPAKKAIEFVADKKLKAAV
jgi:nucleoid DNA-binding protein